DLLAKVETWAQGRKDPFTDLPALTAEGPQEFAATYQVLWRGVPFDTERVLVERKADGERVIHAQTIDPHRGQWMTAHVWAGATGAGQRLVLDSDGGNGRGRVEGTREGTKAHLRGTVLAGVETTLDADLPEGVLLVPGHFLASKILMGPELAKLDVGKA